MTVVEGYRGVLSIHDNLTRYTKFLGVKTRIGEELVHGLLTHLIVDFGFPKIIHEDHAKDFLLGVRKSVVNCLRWNK